MYNQFGYTNSSAHDHFSKKYTIFLRFMAKNDVKGFDWFKNLTSFLAMKNKKMEYIFERCPCALEFLYPIVLKLKYINLEVIAIFRFSIKLVIIKINFSVVKGTGSNLIFFALNYLEFYTNLPWFDSVPLGICSIWSAFVRNPSSMITEQHFSIYKYSKRSN